MKKYVDYEKKLKTCKFLEFAYKIFFGLMFLFFLFLPCFKIVDENNLRSFSPFEDFIAVLKVFDFSLKNKYKEINQVALYYLSVFLSFLIAALIIMIVVFVSIELCKDVKKNKKERCL